MPLTRRTFLAASALTSLSRAATRRPIRLGGPIFLKSERPQSTSKEHRRLGYSAAYCPQAGAVRCERIRAIRDAFAGRKCGDLRGRRVEEHARSGCQSARPKPHLCDGAAGAGRSRGRALLRGYRGLLQSEGLVRSRCQKPVAGVLRRHGGELPQSDRRGEAHPHPIHRRNDGLESARRSGLVPETHLAPSTAAHLESTWTCATSSTARSATTATPK